MPESKSKYKLEYDKQSEVACRLGATDKELAEMFQVDVRTIQNWKNEHEAFFHSIKKGKDFFDTEIVENALLKRARGFEYKEVKTVLDTNGKAIPDQTQITQRQALPDTGACAFWLKNRNPARWRDKPEQTSNGAANAIADFITKLSRNDNKKTD